MLSKQLQLNNQLKRRLILMILMIFKEVKIKELMVLMILTFLISDKQIKSLSKIKILVIFLMEITIIIKINNSFNNNSNNNNNKLIIITIC